MRKRKVQMAGAAAKWGECGVEDGVVLGQMGDEKWGNAMEMAAAVLAVMFRGVTAVKMWLGGW